MQDYQLFFLSAALQEINGDKASEWKPQVELRLICDSHEWRGSSNMFNIFETSHV